MKHLFNNLSQEEKQSILEMHKGTKMVFSEQTTPTTTQQQGYKKPSYVGTIKISGVTIWDGRQQPQGTEEIVKKIQGDFGKDQTGILDHDTAEFIRAQFSQVNKQTGQRGSTSAGPIEMIPTSTTPA